MIKAEVHSDDHRYAVSFDAEPYFAQATDKEIEELKNVGFGGDLPADDVAYFFESLIPEIKELLDYCRPDNTGFECHVDAESALDWLAHHKPHLVN